MIIVKNYTVPVPGIVFFSSKKRIACSLTINYILLFATALLNMESPILILACFRFVVISFLLLRSSRTVH
jgi:hypothetical protein